jgi:hypothetical protein
MTRFIYIFCVLGMFLGLQPQAQAGNPDRQGEAGAGQLLMIPYARIAGLHAMTTASVSGVEAMRLNVAGIGRFSGPNDAYQTQFVGSYGIYLQGADIGMSAFGMTRRLGKSGALGVSVMALDFGDIPVTTTDQPEGTGATFSPRFLNVGLGYSHTFENKVSVGILARGISESIADLNGSTFAIDAGVQYVTGEQDNFKFGISLRNIGGRMRYDGEGVSFSTNIPRGSEGYDLAVDQRTAGFELQSMLNIGASYDFLLGPKARLTVIGNFTSNAFSQDQIGGGVEFALNEMVMLRGGYRLDFGATARNVIQESLYTGPSAGVSVEVPFNKDKANGSRFGIDYGYRMTRIYGGTHNLGVRLNLN